MEKRKSPDTGLAFVDVNSLTIKLCIEGTKAEFQGQTENARILYQRAWETAQGDYEACIAAHYVARFQESADEILRWNQKALDYADAAKDDRVKAFYPSLYLNMGRSYELLGNLTEAQRYFNLAADLGLTHTFK